jgi:hypothetical protein
MIHYTKLGFLKMAEGFLLNESVPSAMNEYYVRDLQAEVEIDGIYCLVELYANKHEREVKVTNADDWMLVGYGSLKDDSYYEICVWPYPYDKEGNRILKHLLPKIEIDGSGFKYPGFGSVSRVEEWTMVEASRDVREILYEEIDLMGLPITGGNDE